MNVFDVIGPVMIGPSSSHTAGACRIGQVARSILDDMPVQADITLCGSFAQTYRGHGTDRALIAGLLGLASDDARLPQSMALAAQQGLEFHFSAADLPGVHPNTAVLALRGKTGAACTVQACSVGGGNIRVTRINGTDVSFTGQYDTLIVLHTDEAGAIAAVSGFIAGRGVNIATFACDREERGGRSIMTIEVDAPLSEREILSLRTLPSIHNVVQIRRI
ncbi:MAG: L-serine ammonia-lyase, iron-sulfur-dependent subunit beta [Gemmiger sp.]